MRVLLADDQPSVRSALNLILEQQTDMPVAGDVTDADSLLKWLTANQADVLLLDWELPGISGKQLITILRSVAPAMKIIAMDSSPQTKQAALTGGADDFVSKGEPPEILISVLENIKIKSGQLPVIIQSSGTTKDFGLSGFNRINISAAIKAEIIPSNSYRVTSSVEDYEYVKVEQNGEKLFITRRGFSWASLFHDQPKVKIEMPALLYEIMAVGACKVTLRNFHLLQKISIELTGASQIEIIDVDIIDASLKATGACRINGSLKSSGNVSIDLSGASHIDLDGSGHNVALSATGASHAHLDQFVVNDVDVKLSGASHSTVNMDGKLNIRLSGASHLSWLGKPTLGDIDVTGSSQIHRK
jgi:DNA-binding NarL/FixJ family response regulator